MINDNINTQNIDRSKFQRMHKLSGTIITIKQNQDKEESYYLASKTSYLWPNLMAINTQGLSLAVVIRLPLASSVSRPQLPWMDRSTH
jgi:hypothetical protein